MKLYSNTPFIDSLELEIKDVHGEKKLERMFQIANIYITSEKLYSIGSWIETEATKQNNERYVAGSYNLKARHYLQQNNNLDSVIYYANLANTIYDDNNLKNTNQGYFYIINVYFEKGSYALAISHLKDLLMIDKNDLNIDLRTYLMMSDIFSRLGNYEIALEYLEEARKKNDPSGPYHEQNLLNTYILSAQNYMYMKNYNMSSEYISKMDLILENNASLIPKMQVQQYLFKLALLNIDLYFYKKDVKMVQLSLNKLKQVSTDIDLNPLKKIEIESSEAQFYILKGEYEKALPLLDKSAYFINYYYPAQYQFAREIIALKIEALKKLGRLNEAMDTQANLMQYNDSIYKQNLSTLPYQIAELSETHKLAKVRLEQEKDQAILEKSRTINISLITAFVVLGVMFYIVRKNLKKTREKNKLLVKQYNELEIQKNLLKGKSSTSKENQRESTLFEEIETYIEQNEAFRDSTLNRESLAKAINTNEIYVAKAIKQMTGKTFVEYINQYRLEYSRQRLLAEISEPVKVILQDAGFSSDTSFYRLFKEAYGMSSSEMRQAKEELDKENAKKE